MKMHTDKQLKRTLLIVDDEKELLEILKETLHPLCDQVLTANNGFEALEIIDAATPDSPITAILSDISMPKMNGFELLSILRNRFNPVPFVVLTGFGDTQNYLKAIKLNATDFAQKPYEMNELLKIMTRALRYGVELIDSERKIEAHLRSFGLNAEQISEQKRLKRTVVAMRIEQDLYLKNKN